ncbi:helix-turn-helix transcriptional regulator [Nonomuraea lactucae]|uniref:helix-turn-helix transcriptional regulator n=1 Tax=Nonomuraea lactucae TaxID=2249762 RepID=UPI000DE350B6|nr:helix-turn-helix domain-containing protein [Nonomuraea lactucae]
MNRSTKPPTLAQAAAREEKYLTVREIAARMRVCKMTAYRLVHGDAFPGTIRVGRSIRVPATAVDAYLKGSVISHG